MNQRALPLVTPIRRTARPLTVSLPAHVRTVIRASVASARWSTTTSTTAIACRPSFSAADSDDGDSTESASVDNCSCQSTETDRSFSNILEVAARYDVLRDGTPVPPVDVQEPSVLNRSGEPGYDIRSIADGQDERIEVHGEGRRYHRRGENRYVSQNHLAPTASSRYVCADRSGREAMVKTIRERSVPPNVYAAYVHVLNSFPRLLLHPGISGTGLSAGEKIQSSRYLIEYTGNRIRGENCRKMHRALNRIDSCPDVFVAVRKESSTIDPRRCGNASMFVNHSCYPNVQLFELTLGTKRIVVIQALREIAPGEGITIDYGYNSLRDNSVLICECGSVECRLAV